MTPLEDFQARIASASFDQGGAGVIVACEPIVEFLGLEWWTEYEFVKLHAAFQPFNWTIYLHPKGRHLACLSEPLFAMWIMSIDPERVASEHRAVLREYRDLLLKTHFVRWAGHAGLPGGVAA